MSLETLATVADILTGDALRTAGDTDPVTAFSTLLASDSSVIKQLIDALDTPGEAEALSRARDRAQQRLGAGRPDGAPLRDPLHWPIAFPEVFSGTKTPGFDAIVGNPPFMGGQKITGTAGTDYRNYLITWIADGRRGSADLVAYFFLNAAKVAQAIGFLATNTIAQGTTSEVGLAQILGAGWRIHRAASSTAWPGDATLEIAKVWATFLPWKSEYRLDGLLVAGIDEMLYPKSRSGWRKQRLVANAEQSFQGSIVLGMGFTMSPGQAEALIARDPRNRDVLFPYLGGEDLTQSPAQTPPRWVINFFDWPEEQARQYADCFEIVEEMVKPERSRVNDVAAKTSWWRFKRPTLKLYRTIDPLKRVLAISRVGKTVQPVFVATGPVLADSTVVFTYDDYFHFGVLTSGFHYRWAIRYASSLETRARYTPSDVFETFPQPSHDDNVASVAEELDVHRSRLMTDRDLGLTGIYNLVHGPDIQSDEGIQRLRDLHIALDIAVRDAYGWGDMELGHGFNDVRGQGVRFTISPEATNRVLELLLELNKERYQAEVAAGLHKKVQTKTKSRTSNLEDQPELLGVE
ncbi:MAG: hypothetical protein F4Z96_04335 [Chloroflexi bacterium]|nr:hypothetical protein [Chloroflexota bacterium]